MTGVGGKGLQRESSSVLSPDHQANKDWAAAATAATALNDSRKISANKHTSLESSPRGHGAQARDLACALFSWNGKARSSSQVALCQRSGLTVSNRNEEWLARCRPAHTNPLEDCSLQLMAKLLGESGLESWVHCCLNSAFSVGCRWPVTGPYSKPENTQPHHPDRTVPRL